MGWAPLPPRQYTQAEIDACKARGGKSLADLDPAYYRELQRCKAYNQSALEGSIGLLLLMPVAVVAIALLIWMAS